MLEGQPKLCGYILRGTKMIGLDENSMIDDIYDMKQKVCYIAILCRAHVFSASLWLVHKKIVIFSTDTIQCLMLIPTDTSI